MKLYPERGAWALPWALGALGIVTAWLFYPEHRDVIHDVPEVAVNKRPTLIVDGGRRFEDLTPKNQAFVRENYKHLLTAHDSRDFQTMFERSRNILSLVDEYNDTKHYENIAKIGMDHLEEQRRAVQREEKRAQIRREVELLENAGREVAAQGFRNPAVRETIGQLVREIYTKDPNNHLAAEWMRQAREAVAAESRDIQRKQLATLEIKGQGLVKKAVRSPASRAELYKVMDDIRVIDPNNLFVEKWKRSLLKD